MDADTFREFGKAAIDFIADYMENLRDRDVLPSVTPGYLLDLLPKELPDQPQKWQEVLQDVTKLIIPGLTHWQSPNFHAFFPTGGSYPSIVGEMLSMGFSVIGFNWFCSPACTELEVVMMDWLAKFFKLPTHFLHSTEGPGGGIIQGSASESVLVAVMAAREQALRRVKLAQPQLTEGEIRARLIGYSSDQSNCCIEKAGVLATVPIRLLPANENQILSGIELAKAVKEDLAKGLIPTIFIATMGTTGTCACDDIPTLANVCNTNQMWLHVDAAYAGALLALDENAHLRQGLDRVDSLNYNLHKSLAINFDCTAMWLRNANLVIDSFNVDRIYLENKYEGKSDIPEFRNWQIPLGRRFRALKVWMTFRIYGAEGLRNHIRKQIRLAERFEKFILTAHDRLELISKCVMGLVCFRVRGQNDLTVELLKRITERKKVYMIQACYRAKNFIRFAICGNDPKEEDVDFAWHEIDTQLNILLAERAVKIATEEVTHLKQSEVETYTDIQNIFRKGDLESISQHLSSGLHTNLEI